jgi:hypothetical protein
LDFNRPLVVLGDFNADVGADRYHSPSSLSLSHSLFHPSLFSLFTLANSVKVWTHKLRLKNAYDKLTEANNNNNDTNISQNNKHDKAVKNDITWHWKLPLNIKMSAKFDHILYSGLECVKYGVKISGASDYYPIFAHFIHF